jgi:hypothetical protein
VNINFLVKLKQTANESVISYAWCMRKAEELLRALAQNYFRRLKNTEQCASSDINYSEWDSM